MVTTYIAIMVTVAFAVVAIALMMRKERREKEEYKQFEAMREAPLSPPMTQPAPDPSLGLKEVQKGTALMRGAVVVGGDVIVFQIEFAVQDERWMDNGIPTMKGPRIFLQPLTHRLGDSIATKLAECAKRPDRPVPKAIAQSALAGSLATTLRVQGLPEECITAKL
ncbi:hypothetical protein FJZ48_04545, partial [Candidatus Uhrbacteria bacterium]|nr:hypothetical protein [Candidatus Uhrbacteria bacterium]